MSATSWLGMSKSKRKKSSFSDLEICEEEIVDEKEWDMPDFAAINKKRTAGYVVLIVDKETGECEEYIDIAEHVADMVRDLVS